MKLIENKLVAHSTSVKARSGTSTTKAISVKLDDYVLMVGDLKFPLAVLNKLSFNPNGTLGLVGNKIAVTLDNLWHTINTVSFEVSPNVVEGQQASYTIQHADRSIVLNNLTEQVATIPYEDGKPINITAINYATGALTNTTVDGNPGQAYSISSVSSSSIVGELKTVGGELISGGELKNVCVSEEYDFENAPIAYDNTFVKEYLGLNTISYYTEGQSEASKKQIIQNQYLEYITGTITNNPGVTLSYPEFNYIVSKMVTGTKAFNIGLPPTTETAFNALTPVLNGIVFTVPTTSTDYDLVYWVGTNPVTNINFNSQSTLPFNGLISLQANKDYVLFYDAQINAPDVIIGPEIPSTNPGYATSQTLDIKNTASVKIKILGPLVKHCVSYQQIDTRYSYTTPVVTTDTRQTVNQITLTVTPIN